MERDVAPNILVVDDTPDNLRVLSGMLKERGYRVRPVPSGGLALRAAESEPPDLILLDITMPGMDGYEVCRRLKADAGLKDIPVIFISALSDTADKVEAFSVGGVDYVPKPFQFPEVEARVDTHLRLRRLRRDIEQKNRALEENIAKLRELEKLRDNLVHMIVHDMRSPLTVITASLGFLQEDLKGKVPAESMGDIGTALQGGQRLIRMVSDLLDISRLEAGEMPLKTSAVDVTTVAKKAVDSVQGIEKGRTVEINAPGPLVVICDPELIRRVIENLVSNGIKHTPEGTPLWVTVAPEARGARVTVRDTGEGIAPEYHVKIFEKFGQVQAKKEQRYHSTGLGLSFCKLAVEAHGGKIGVESAVGAGSTFWFTLPGQPGGAAEKRASL
ncbi:MAG: hybrid sensor histidine kinase/response regulator [Deltaproteobacteria bacterium]|nr:hybrid sensor histidine kinase/response regulator [Deltaproteobacteria bacterium]